MPYAEQIGNLFRSYFALEPEDLGNLAEEAAALLHSWSAYREPLSGLYNRLNNLLFDCFYSLLGPSMTLRGRDGHTRRVTLSRLADLTDDLMGLLFETFRPAYAAHYERLHAYWMETGSPAAVRCLYSRYADLLPPRERSMMEMVMRENPPSP